MPFHSSHPCIKYLKICTPFFSEVCIGAWICQVVNCYWTVWSESSLSTWRNLGSLANPLSAQPRLIRLGRAQADLSLRWADTHFVGFVMSWLISLRLALKNVCLLFTDPDFSAWDGRKEIFLCCFLYQKNTLFQGETTTLQSHYNATRYNTVLVITRPVIGSQMVIFLLFLYKIIPL